MDTARLIFSLSHAGHSTLRRYRFQMFEVWANLHNNIRALIPALPDARSGADAQAPARVISNGRAGPTISREFLDSLSGDILNHHYGFRSLDSAALVLRTARQMDCRLQDNASVDAFFALLGEVTRAGLNASSFAGRSVVAIEGLEGSGKSMVAAHLRAGCSELGLFDDHSNVVVNDVREVFLCMPELVSKAFVFATNYIIAYDVLRSPHSAFMVESYHHAICANNVCEKVLNEAGVNALNPSVFSWPFDLPQPELVLFLSIPTALRLKRVAQVPEQGLGQTVGQGQTQAQAQAQGLGQVQGLGLGQGQGRVSNPPRSRRSSSSINERSGARIVMRDAKANVSSPPLSSPSSLPPFLSPSLPPSLPSSLPPSLPH
ncbi:hypothetical protein B484DRAFT_142362 [Ochromonadaceae sp. CCMP2298]|nr:hypothetical protein B484DRAFT_142362 [Ochromonadaceae sp. CCMP2298]